MYYRVMMNIYHLVIYKSYLSYLLWCNLEQERQKMLLPEEISLLKERQQLLQKLEEAEPPEAQERTKSEKKYDNLFEDCIIERQKHKLDKRSQKLEGQPRQLAEEKLKLLREKQLSNSTQEPASEESEMNRENKLIAMLARLTVELQPQPFAGQEEENINDYLASFNRIAIYNGMECRENYRCHSTKRPALIFSESLSPDTKENFDKIQKELIAQFSSIEKKWELSSKLYSLKMDEYIHRLFIKDLPTTSGAGQH